MRLRERRRLCRVCLCSSVLLFTLYSLVAHLLGISVFTSFSRLLTSYPEMMRHAQEATLQVHQEKIRLALTHHHDQLIKTLTAATNTESGRFTKVHIVEEHHEVLPLWLRRFVEPTLSAPKEPVLPMGRSILIHIDAHSDLANPDTSAFLYPRMRLPTTLREVVSMLQGNDQFIMSMMVMGMFTDVIWVYPAWMEDETNYGEVTFHVGFHRYAPQETLFSSSTFSSHSSSSSSSTNGRTVMCVCALKSEIQNIRAMRPSPSKSTSSSTEMLSCSFTPPENDTDIIIPANSCQIMSSTRVTVVKDLYAITFMQLVKHRVEAKSFSPYGPDSPFAPSDTHAYKSAIFRVLKVLHPGVDADFSYYKKLLTDDTLRTTTPLPYILDIDEDFFGVQFAGWSLNRTGVDVMKDIRPLNDVLGTVFCSLDGARGEKLFQRWLLGHIVGDLFLDKWKCWKHISNDSQNKKVDDSTEKGPCNHFEDAYIEMSTSLFNEKKLNVLLCSTTATPRDPAVRAMYRHLWQFLRTRTRLQLLALLRVGVCMQESASVSTLRLRAWQMDKLEYNVARFGLGFCVGNNEPGSRTVTEHNIFNEDFSRQMQRIETFFGQLRAPPALITVCRSSRDGYVPRSWQGRIESHLLQLFAKWGVIHEDRGLDVSYDRDLWTPADVSFTDVDV